MMTIDDIYDILREVDYKPGWHIDIMAEPGDGGRPYLQVRIDERSAASEIRDELVKFVEGERVEATVLEWRRASVCKIEILAADADGVVVPVRRDER